MGKTKIKTVKETPETIDTPVVEVKIEETTKEGGKKAAPKVSKRAQKKAAGKTKQRSKKYLEVSQEVEVNKRYSLKEAVELAQKTSYSKFPGTIETHINTALKNIRGSITLPFLAGKKLTILAFGTGAEKAGADIVGTEETIEQIEKGKAPYDVIVATPEWMPKLAKVAKVLGPRGLMPSPKNDTVTENIAKVITDLRGGKTEYKTENNGQVIHLAIGKTTQASEEVVANIKVLYNTIGRSKIKKITLSPSMGPGVKVDLGSI